MLNRIHLLIIPLAVGLTACAPQKGKNTFNPNDVGTDINTGTGTNSGTDGTSGNAVDAQPFPDDAQKFNQAWNRTDTQLILDCYQGNSLNWDQMATDKRVVGLIHRATIGLRIDTQFKARQAIAAQHGYLWGGYALGLAGDPIAQAQLYLQTLGDPVHDLMVLDLENTSDSTYMNIANAKIFMNYVYQQTGRVPVIYANNSVTRELSSALQGDPVFAQSRLWYARFRSSIPDFPSTLWPTYFLWQFSSEINCSSTGHCLYNVPGTNYQIDVNVFYGSKAALDEQWQT